MDEGYCLCVSACENFGVCANASLQMHEYVLHEGVCVYPVSSGGTFNSLMNDVMLWAVL